MSRIQKEQSQKKKTDNQQKGWKIIHSDSDEEEEYEEEEPVPNETETQKTPTQEPMESQSGKNSNPMEISGTKRQHSLDTSDSDKKNPRPDDENPLQIVPIIPSQGEWRKVEKKKGRKS